MNMMLKAGHGATIGKIEEVSSLLFNEVVGLSQRESEKLKNY